MSDVALTARSHWLAYVSAWAYLGVRILVFAASISALAAGESIGGKVGIALCLVTTSGSLLLLRRRRFMCCGWGTAEVACSARLLTRSWLE